MENEILVTVLGIYEVPSETGKYFVLTVSEVPSFRMPIFIGQNEAFMIAYAKDGLPRERPLTFDLFAETIAATGFAVTKILITHGSEQLNSEQLYYATVTIQKDEAVIELDARPSDAIALALTTGAAIFVSEKTLIERGTPG